MCTEHGHPGEQCTAFGRSGSCCATLGMPGRMFVGESDCPALGREGVRLRGSGVGPASVASLTTCTPEGAPVTWRAGLALVRALSGARLGLPAGMATVQQEVQQLVRTRADLRGRGRTVTCTDGRGWTCCRQMACKRSAVRARLAPLVRSQIRTNRTASTAAKYSNGGRVGRRTCVRIGHLPRLGLLAGHRIPGANRRWSVCHLGKSLSHRSRDSCRRVTTGPPGGPFPPVTVAAFASSPVALALLAVRSTPRSRVRWPGPRVR